jgi:F-type H+/Na+-transporting ATPase subunit beta
MNDPAPEMIQQEIPKGNRGTIVSVRGSVIDARLPDRQNVLVSGEQRLVVIEVQSHLSRDLVRGITLTPGRGMSRNAIVIDTGKPLTVPVGMGCLGRMFNVFGQVIDGQPAPEDVQWVSIHGEPVPLHERTITSFPHRHQSH